LIKDIVVIDDEFVLLMLIINSLNYDDEIEVIKEGL
jgi:hypothetical protein